MSTRPFRSLTHANQASLPLGPQPRRCRGCGHTSARTVLSLGSTPLANGLLRPGDLDLNEAVFPLELALCTSCSLVQILESVPPETLFSNYPYFSSCSETMVRHAEEIAWRMIADRELGDNSLVVEVASNDGYLLQFYRSAGIPVLGIEPASNVADVAEDERGIPTLRSFFGVALARALQHDGCQADVIHANNVLAHVPDLNGFVEGIAVLLKPGGVAVIEVPYVRDMIEQCEFDTIYHEHLCYFSVTALNALFARHGLQIENVERLPIHGGSLRLFVTHLGWSMPGPSVMEIAKHETDCGLGHLEYYQGFARRVDKLKEELRRQLYALKQAGMRLAAYGAAAKGSTLLNYCGIGSETLDFVVDRNQHKQGLYMPGARLQVFPPEKLLETQPGAVLLLTWNFAEEIMAQQAEYLRRGGKFIIPIPSPHTAGADATEHQSQAERA